MLRSVRLFSEIIAAAIGIVIVLSVLLVWRLNNSSMRSSFLTPYIEKGIESMIPGAHAKIASTLVTWDSENRSATLHADAIQVTGPDGHTIVQIPSMGVRLSALGIILGEFLPSELIVDHPQIWLERKSDGSFYFGGAPTTGNFSESANGETNFLNVLEQVINSLSQAYITKKLFINHVVVSVHDEDSSSDWAINIPEINLERAMGGLAGLAQLDLTQENSVSTVSISYKYERKRKLHTLTSHFDSINPSFFAGGHPATFGLGKLSIVDAPLSGEISLTLDDDIKLHDVMATIHSDDGFLNYKDFWDKPRSFKSADLNLTYNRNSDKLDIPKAFIDINGTHIEASLTGVSSKTPGYDLDVSMNAKVDNWPLDQTQVLWPKTIAPDAREWIVPNLRVGKFDHAEGVFKASLAGKTLDKVLITDGKGKITGSNAEVHYMDAMPPVTGVNAEGAFDLNHITLQMKSGGIDNLKLNPFQLTITGLEDEDQFIDIPLSVTGPIPDLMKLIDHDPLGYARALGLPTDGISGNVDGVVNFHFPLLKNLAMKDIDIKALATLSSMASSQLVPGLDLTQGKLTLNLTKTGINISGPILANTVPLKITSWNQVFDTSQGNPEYKATITSDVNGDQWPFLGFDLLNGSKGVSKLTLNLTQFSHSKLLIAGQIDLGSSEVHLALLNWSKPSGTPAAVQFAAELPEQGNIKVTTIKADGSALTLKGSAELQRNTKQLLSINLSPFIMGRSNATVKIEQANKEHDAILYEATGKSFDVSGFRGGKDEKGIEKEAKEYRFNIGTLHTSEHGTLSNASGYAIRDKLGWSEINLHAQTNDNHPLALELKPQGNIRSFDVTSDDFGSALEGMGFTEAIHEGELNIHGESTPENPRLIKGKIKVGHCTAKNLPILALLLNATSPFGIIGIVTDSVDFDKISGHFSWEGDKIELEGINLSGSAIGLNVEGKADMNNGNAALHGTIVPFSMVNRFINYIPILGDIITGGKDQGVLAVAFKINGSLAKPNIDVNPVSLLTPGFLRNIFFGGDDDEGDISNDNDHHQDLAPYPNMKSPAPSGSNFNSNQN